MSENWSQVDLIREAFHYQNRFDGSTMVFKIDFPVTLDPLFPSLVKDLALLSRTGFRVVIVPGAKEWIDEVLNKYGIVSTYKGHLRITAPEAMPFVQMAAFHTATRFMTGFAGSRTEAVIGNFVRARGLGVLDGVDFENTGTVDKIYIDSLNHVLERGMIPILPCIGWSPSGKPYNVSSDEIALEAAIKLKAIKLFVISLDEGIVKKEKRTVNNEQREQITEMKTKYSIPLDLETGANGRVIRLTPQQAKDILEMNKVHSQDKAMRELALALKAGCSGVERVHIINGAEEGAVLKELFSNLGAGTMLYADEYESIRALHSKDIPDVLRLMEPLMQDGYLIRRSQDDIQNKKEDYAVFEIDGRIHACAALHDWGEGQGEIAGLATDPSFADLGLGRRIVRYFIDQAQKQGLSRVFVLTTRSHDWFESLGFKESSVESLSQKKQQAYDKSRNSKVFALEF